MMLFAKIISVVLALIVISKTLLDFRKKQEGLAMFLFWTLTWGAVIVLSISPELIEKINFMVGEKGNGVNTFLGAAFVFLLFVTYRIYTKANRLEKKIHDMVMKLGLKEIEKDE